MEDLVGIGTLEEAPEEEEEDPEASEEADEARM